MERHNMKNLLLIAGDYTLYLAKKLIEENIFDNIFCLLFRRYINSEVINFFNNNERLAYCVADDVELYENYEDFCDLNAIPALDKKTLTDMLPYESMALRLGRRRDEYPVIDYEEEKMYYEKALRYWSYIFSKYQINYMFNDREPHYRYAYIIYALAKIQKCKILLCTTSSIPDIMVYGDSIETAGNHIKEYYNSLEKCDYDIPMGRVLEYYQKYTQPIEEIKEVHVSWNKNNQKEVSNEYFSNHLGIKGHTRLLRSIIHEAKRNPQGKQIRELKQKIPYFKWVKRNRRRIAYFLRHDACSLADYNKIAVDPDYSKKYIYFALQLTPEETIMPKAGVFADQYNSIQLIARIAQKYGIWIYVKEHFVQAYREKEFYRILQTIPNVKLIKTTVMSFDLIENSIAVATQTGTCILEGVLKGKPAIVTSSGQIWKGIPYVYEIEDELQGSEIMQKIVDGIIIENEAVKRYFYAIAESTFYLYPAERPDDVKKPEYADGINKLTQLLSDFTDDRLSL